MAVDRRGRKALGRSLFVGLRAEIEIRRLEEKERALALVAFFR
jgi:hypothetical protein